MTTATHEAADADRQAAYFHAGPPATSRSEVLFLGLGTLPLQRARGLRVRHPQRPQAGGISVRLGALQPGVRQVRPLT